MRIRQYYVENFVELCIHNSRSIAQGNNELEEEFESVIDL